MNISAPYVINDLPVSKNKFKSLHDKLTHKLQVRVYKRTRVAEAQNWVCCFCGIKCIEEPGKRNSATLEHFVPKSQKGSDDMDNLVMSCHKCNSARAVEDALTFYSRRLANG